MGTVRCVWEVLVAWMECGGQKNQGFSKAGWKMMFKSKMIAGWSLEQNWNKSPKLSKSVHTQPCSCTTWIQALIYILDAPQLRFRVSSQVHIYKNITRASTYPYIFIALHKLWETREERDLETIALSQSRTSWIQTIPDRCLSNLFLKNLQQSCWASLCNTFFSTTSA